MILLSAIPGFIAILVLVIGVKETPAAAAPTAAAPPLAFSALSGGMRRYLAVVGVFTLARASETFILLLGHQRGALIVELLLLWAALSFAKATTSTLGGRIADRVPRGAVVAISWSAFALSFALFAVLPGQQALWLITVAYGLFAGFGEGAERAVIGDFSAEQERGTAFGWYNLVLGLAAIPAGLLFGGLWHYAGASTAFLTAAGLALVSVVLLRAWAWPRVTASA
jgi:MFS family permease